MSTKWSAEVVNGKGGAVNFDDLFKDQSAVLLLRGKNIFGDFVYCYLQSNVRQLKELYAVLKGDSNKEFSVSDYGTVIAAGKGEPPPDVKAEVALAFPGMPDNDTTIHQSAGITPEMAEKKNWDEY